MVIFIVSFFEDLTLFSDYDIVKTMKWTKKKIEEKQKKYKEIIKMRDDGYSLRAIASVYDMTPEGVRWIINHKRPKDSL